MTQAMILNLEARGEGSHLHLLLYPEGRQITSIAEAQQQDQAQILASINWRLIPTEKHKRDWIEQHMKLAQASMEELVRDQGGLVIELPRKN